MEYADIVVAVIATFILAWIADMVTGRRGLFATSLVAGIGAACGWFLAVRVFAVSVMTDWTWVGWSLVGAILALVAFFLFRSKR